MERASGGGACLAPPGADFTDRIRPMERLGVYVDGISGAAAKALACPLPRTSRQGCRVDVSVRGQNERKRDKNDSPTPLRH